MSNFIPDTNQDEQGDRDFWSEQLPTEGECDRCHKVKQTDDLDYDRICLGCREIMDMEWDAQHLLTYPLTEILAHFDKQYRRYEPINDSDL